MSRAYASPVGRTRRASCFGISAVHDNGVILEKTRPRVMRTRCLAGFERTYLASRFPHRVRARRRVLDDRLERHLRSGARRLPRRARPARDLGFKNPRRAASRTRREVIGRAAHAAFEGQATGRRVPSARTLRPASVSILRARPSTGGTQECAAARKGRPKDARTQTRAARVANQRSPLRSPRQTKSGKSQTGEISSLTTRDSRETRETTDSLKKMSQTGLIFGKKCLPLSRHHTASSLPLSAPSISRMFTTVSRCTAASFSTPRRKARALFAIPRSKGLRNFPSASRR